MARLKKEFTDRTKKFSHRMVDVAEALARTKIASRVKGRIIDQMVGAGTSIGANVREASEALSSKDFVKALGISLKELGESRYWLEFVRERNRIKAPRLAFLEKEGDELARILNVIIARTKRNAAKA